jgi:hypothetical protein
MTNNKTPFASSLRTRSHPEERLSIGIITAIKSYTSPITCMFSKASVIARCREYVVLKTIHKLHEERTGSEFCKELKVVCNEKGGRGSENGSCYYLAWH